MSETEKKKRKRINSVLHDNAKIGLHCESGRLVNYGGKKEYISFPPVALECTVSENKCLLFGKCVLV